MLDSDDSALLLDHLCLEKPNMHSVTPKHQEARLWQLEEPPSLTHIPATQDIQEEAEAITTLHKKRTFQPPFKRPTCIETPLSKSSYRGLFGGEGFLDYCPDSCQNIRGTDDTLQDSSHPTMSSFLSLNCNKNPPLRKSSLFKMHVLTSGGDSSKMDDLGGGSGSQTTSTPQTFLSQVTMTTVPPPPPPQPPQATVGHAAPPFPCKPPRSTPPLGSSAASGRPSQQAPHAEMQDKGTKRAFVPPMTPRPLHIQGSSGSGVLRPVSEIPIKFRSVFNEFPFFNYVQSKALDDVLYTNKNFVACAPTGSGKTVLFELAIIRLLMETQEPWSDVKAVYMAPIKALCSQCFENWKKKFGPFGLICKELTGDTEIEDFFEIHDSHIILTTPEKWDSMTRRWKNNCLLQLVRLFLIDEVHVVKDTTRGATLEVVVSRMKALHAYRTSQNTGAGLSMRFLAVSATIPNISDIAEWLADESGPATCLDMDESHRPVKLKKVILGFPSSSNQSEFKFDLSLNYRMANIIQTYSDQKPALVFCSTRKGAQQSAAVLAKDARFIMSIEHKQRLTKYANSILDSKLKELVVLGVGYHHAGVHVSDRKMIEEAFTLGDLPVLFTTRTLAMGVNLPAHLVVIKSTMQYVAGSCEEYSEADLLQMIGRAGRPQFDTSATAVIMTKIQTKDKYSKLMSGMEIIESSLHGHLVEHLNAEIVLQTISNVSMALDWIRSTFLYIRALKNPTHYGFSADLDRSGIEAKFQELCLKNLNSLSSIGLIDMDEDINIKPSEAGRLMARYCVAFETMKQFNKVVGTEKLSDLIELVSSSREFSDIQLRVNEKRSLNTLNRDKNRTTIRFPMEGKIKTNEMKVNCLIQAQLGTISIQEFGLTQDTAKIFRIGMRISKCLSEFLSQRSKTGFSAVLNSLILAKCFRAKLWENSPYVSKQLEKIGQSLSTTMVNAGLTTFSKIEETNPRELELILNRHPPFGNQIRESVVHLPKYDVSLEQLPRYSKDTAELLVKVSLMNQAQLLSKRTTQDNHYVSLIIGDTDNTVVFLQKLTDSVLLKSGSWSKKVDVSKASNGAEVTVHLISSEYVGLDLQHKFSLYYSTAWKTENPCNITQDPPRHEPQQSAQGLSLANQTKNVTSNKDPVAGNKRQCNHVCKNKELCAHDCCKLGVSVTRKRSSNQESSFTSHLKDLRSRCDTLTETPVKCLKLKMNEESVSVSMKDFSYKPKEMLHPNPWYGQTHRNNSVRPSAVVDLTGGDSIQDVADMNDFDRACQMWMTPQISDRNEKSEQNSHQIHSTNSASTITRSHQETLRNNTFFNQTVCFELGNEWKDYCDWGDFDDEDLVHASETLLPSCTTGAKPQTHQRPTYSMTGCVSSSVPPPPPPPPLSHSHTKPCVTSNTTAQRSLSSSLSPDFRNLGFSPLPPSVTPQKRITLDWKNKTTNNSSHQITTKKPQIQPKPTNVGQVTRKFDFFSKENIPAGASSSFNCSYRKKEEESFIGIFDGIF